ncbi:UNVERIFIED_CONTAM: hypothetical protein FKN15_016323 [Acipenser sinensis]
MDRNALAELLQALESRRDAEERRREERYTALFERLAPCPTNHSFLLLLLYPYTCSHSTTLRHVVSEHGIMDRNALAELLELLDSRRDTEKEGGALHPH